MIHYIIDVETSGENERDIAYRVALEYVCRKSKDILLAGPYMSVGDFDLKNKNSFRNFINDKGFTLLDYNQIEIVDKEVLVVKGKKKYNIDGITITLNNKNEYSKVASIINSLTLKSENTIVYYSTKSGVERYAREIAPYLNIPSYDKNIDLRLYNMFIQHLEKEFGDEWIITRSLKKGIGIHHGLVPKYIQKQIIEFFNEGILTVLISTTTITEGVNTSAKNIIIRSDKKGTKALKHFDAMNIAGRAGRFYHHYTGRVIVVDNNFNDIYKANDEILEHKNFDIETKKNDIDYLITDSKYLKNHDIQNRDKIYMEVVNRNIPFDIVEQFKTIGIRDKLYIFDSISKLTFEEINEIKSMITKFSYTNNITWDGFQIIVNIICPIVTNKTVSTLIKMRCKNNEEYSLLTAFVYYYLRDGFFGVLNNYLKKYSIDKAMRKTSELIFNTFKYQLVKYLGVFDLMYKCCLMKETNQKFDDVKGISKLVKILEYNVLSEKARKLNDYGVPYNIVNYYEKNNDAIKNSFDTYEKYIFEKIFFIIN